MFPLAGNIAYLLVSNMKQWLNEHKHIMGWQKDPLTS